jgi:hypothetical protein
MGEGLNGMSHAALTQAAAEAQCVLLEFAGLKAWASTGEEIVLRVTASLTALR